MKNVSPEELAACFLFKGLSGEQRQAFAPHVERMSLSRGTIIFTEGDPTDGLYAVASGSVKVFRVTEDGRESVMHVIGPGDVFGEAAFFLRDEFPASAATLLRSEILRVPRRPFFDALENDPEFTKRILAGFALKLRDFTHRFQSLTADSVECRLIKWLLSEFGKQDAGGPIEGRAYEMPIPKTGLAAHLGVAPETLSRTLRSLSDENLIAVQGSQITLKNLQELRERAGGEE